MQARRQEGRWRRYAAGLIFLVYLASLSVHGACDEQPYTTLAQDVTGIRRSATALLWYSDPYGIVWPENSSWNGDLAACCSECCKRPTCAKAFYDTQQTSCLLIPDTSNVVTRKTDSDVTLLERCDGLLPSPLAPGLISPPPPIGVSSPALPLDTLPPPALAVSSTADPSAPIVIASPSPTAPRVIGSVVGAIAAVACCVAAAVIGMRRRRGRSQSFLPATKGPSLQLDSTEPAASPGKDANVFGIPGKGPPSDSAKTTVALDFTIGTQYGIDLPKGLQLFSNNFDNPSLVAAKQQELLQCIANGKYNVSAALDFIVQCRNGHINEKYVLDAGARRFTGGQATVAMATSKYTNAQYAIKFFADQAAFLQEAAVYNFLMLTDPVGSTFVHEAQDNWGVELECGLKIPSYIVMKRGMSMQDWVRNRRPPPLMGIWMLSEVCQQMALLHAHGWVHRDLKPANMLWVPDDNAWRAIDFGCTVKAGDVVPRAFTVRYAAPEAMVAVVNKEVTIQAQQSMDVWALGVMAFEMMSGQLLFPMGSSTSQMTSILIGEALFPHEEDPTVWQKIGKLRTVIQAMLSRDPLQRPSIQEVSERLVHLAMTTAATVGATSGNNEDRSRLNVTSCVESSE